MSVAPNDEYRIEIEQCYHMPWGMMDTAVIYDPEGMPLAAVAVQEGSPQHRGLSRLVADANSAERV